MKTKSKMFALVEIAVVLFSVFLVALPAIAAEQTSQGVSANTITTASEAETLDIYGNANEDDTIDMRDLTYVKLIFFGKKPETDLSDAKYDGKINPLDFIQIKLIIVGKEKELTVVDSAGMVKTINKPVGRIIMLGVGEQAEALRILDAMDKVVGAGKHFYEREYTKTLFPEFHDLPNVGSWDNYEAILSLNPDAVIVYSWYKSTDMEMEEHLPGVTVLRFNFYIGGIMFDEMKKLGYILDREKEAQEYIDFFEEHLGDVKEKMKTLSEDEKPKVYHESATRPYKTFNKIGGATYQIEMAGGRSISADLAGSPTGAVDVDPEWVIEQNPEIIVKMSGWGYSGGGYGEGDPSGLKDLRTSVMNRPELEYVDAVQSKKVYVITYDILYPPCMPVSIAYLAKWFHPDLCEDLDPQAIHQEYLDSFHEILNWNVYEQGVFVYPPLAS